MRLLRHEFASLVSHPFLWIGSLTFSIFVLHAVAHLRVDQEVVNVAIYSTQSDPPDSAQTHRFAQSLLEEMAYVHVLRSKTVTTDFASQMQIDGADIAITRTPEGWRFTIKSRSTLEHSRLVRVAQVLGASLSQKRPWFMIAYEALLQSQSSDSDWPNKIQISGVTADPGPHARVFVPKTMALLSFFMAFAFACRSVIRDTSNNMLQTLVVASRGRWLVLVVAKTLVSVLMGLVTLLTLLLFAIYTQQFHIKDGLYTTLAVQGIGLAISALLGIGFSLLARTEARIYLIGSGYIVLLILLSGLIAEIDPREEVLYWISKTFPLGYAMEMLSDWMFFGRIPELSNNSTQGLLALFILSVVFTYGAVAYLRSKL